MKKKNRDRETERMKKDMRSYALSPSKYSTGCCVSYCKFLFPSLYLHSTRRKDFFLEYSFSNIEMYVSNAFSTDIYLFASTLLKRIDDIE